MAVSPVGNWAVSASKDRTLRLWDLGTGRLLRVLIVRHFGLIESLEQSSGLWDDHVEHHVLAVIEHLGVADPVNPVEDSGAVIVAAVPAAVSRDQSREPFLARLRERTPSDPASR